MVVAAQSVLCRPLLALQQHRKRIRPTAMYSASSSASAASPRLGISSITDHQRLHQHQYQQQIQQQVQRLARLRMNATEGAVLGVEPDLPEASDYVQDSEHMTAFADREDEFPYGTADGKHTWHKGDDNVGFFEAVSSQIKEAGGPNDHPGQAAISWLFLPVIISGLAFNVQAEYLFLVTVLFVFAFIGIEMAKPDLPSNFE